MSKIKDTVGRAGTGIRKVGAGARTTALTAGTGAGATLLITGLLAGGAGSWIDGQRAVDRATTAQLAADVTAAGQQLEAAQKGWQKGTDKLVADARDQVYREMNGIKLISELPDGVDRSKAQEAEQQRRGFMYTEWHGAAVLREPGGRTWYLPSLPTELGRSVTSGARWNGIPFGDDDSADRAARWAAAKRMGAAYAYRDQSGYRVDTAYCTGYWVSLTVPRAGTAVEATTPPLAGAACDRTSPTPRVVNGAGA